MNVDNKINYIELPAKDISATKKFYSDTFFWEFTDYGSDYVAFSNAGLQGGFYQSELSSDAQTGSALVVLFSDSLESTLARVKENGGVINKEIFSFPGGRRFHFLDLSGNELAVWSDS